MAGRAASPSTFHDNAAEILTRLRRNLSAMALNMKPALPQPYNAMAAHQPLFFICWLFDFLMPFQLQRFRVLFIVI